MENNISKESLSKIMHAAMMEGHKMGIALACDTLIASIQQWKEIMMNKLTDAEVKDGSDS